MTATLGGLLVGLAALLLYLASANQQLLADPVPKRAFRWTGLAGFAGGLALLSCSAGPATAVFRAVTLAMLIWSVVPLGIAWLRAARGSGK